jgi:cyanophycinase-like exopeptidase
MIRRLAAAAFATVLVFGAPATGRAAAAEPIFRDCTVTVFPPIGVYAPSGHLGGPGLLLSGAGESDVPPRAFTWMHRQLFGDVAARRGNLVVLRAYYTSAEDKPFYEKAGFSSVQTIRIPPCASRAAVDAVAPIVGRSDAVFFAGGDQADYVQWKGSKLIEAVKGVFARGGIVGGGSAGLAVQGAVIYDSVAADAMSTETHTADAVKNPMEHRISFTTGFFAWPPLAGTITDTHYAVRDRLGRSVVFLARILHDGVLPGAKTIYALGIDEGSAVVVGTDGMGTVLNSEGSKGAYLLRATALPDLTYGKPIVYTVQISHVKREGERFDLLHKQTSDPWYTVTVDGSKSPVYSPEPY